MRVLVTGSAGHLGEALVRTLQNTGYEAVGVDIVASPITSHVGSIADRAHVMRCMREVDAVLHTATLHKPHVATHSRQDFVNTNIMGTLNLLEEAAAAGVGSFILSATTPFLPEDLLDLRVNAPLVVRRRTPEYEAEYARRGWRMFPGIDRVYVNERARKELDWHPRYDFRYVLDRLRAGADFRSPLARTVGSKGYHAHGFSEGPYPVS